MKTAEFWTSVKRVRKMRRLSRKMTMLKKLPVIKAFCEKHKIEIRKVEHGYQFRLREYILNWSPASNQVQVQYALPGHDKTVPYDGLVGGLEPKILTALREVVQLVSAKP